MSIKDFEVLGQSVVVLLAIDAMLIVIYIIARWRVGSARE